MDQEVEEVSFLPDDKTNTSECVGEVILNKKAVYEPTKGQRFRQVVCSKGWALGILLLIGTLMVAIAVIAAFARPSNESTNCASNGQDVSSPSTAPTDITAQDAPQTYIATNGAPFPWKLLRLPATVIPESYSLFLHANITESYFTGNIHMTARVEQNTDFVVFHTRNLNISNVKVFLSHDDNSSGALNFIEELEIDQELEYPRNEQYYLKLKTEVKQSAYIQIQADFRGAFLSLSDVKGFYKSAYTINGEERYIASTQFEASDARSAFPCFDEPSMKATFTISLVRDKNQITLFNMPLKRTAPFHLGLVVDEYEETVKMSTYLVAFIICDFKNITAKTKSGINVSLYATEDKINMGHLALESAVTLLDFYSTFFGTPYPLPKQDLVAVPNLGAGAMENWGLITFRESSLLYDPELSTASAKELIIATVAHELAHQWFGNLVTMKWWDDLWLNEGFATFVENNIGANEVDPSFRKNESVLLDYLDAMKQDSLIYSHPIAVPVNDPVEIDAVFDKISYDKGSAIINMLKCFMGDNLFKQGLSNYLQKHKYGNAETSDLWESLQEVSNLPPHLTISKIMDTWTKQMGLPVVTVIRQNGKLYLSQKRHLLGEPTGGAGAKNEKYQSPYGYKWIIPFTYKTDQDKEKLVWLSDEKEEVELGDDSVKWIKANVDTQGFYRVNYDKSGWQAIIHQLSMDHTVFSVKDRIGLIEDVFNLARAGLTDYRTALNLTTYLVNETDFFAWDVALSHLTFLRGRLFLEEEYDQLKNYILSLTRTHIDSVEWGKQPSPVDEYMQSLMISTAATLGYQPVVDVALQSFQHWKEGKPVKVSNGLRYTVYSQGVKHGTKADWDLVMQQYTKEVVPSEQHIMLSSLSATQDARLLQLLMKYAFDGSKIKPQHSDQVLSQVAGSDNGQLFAWKFLRENYDMVFERFGTGTFAMSNIISKVVAAFNTQFEYDEIVAFFKNKKIGTAKLTLEQSIEYVINHINWAKDYMAVVKSWLLEQSKQLQP